MYIQLLTKLPHQQCHKPSTTLQGVKTLDVIGWEFCVVYSYGTSVFTPCRAVDGLWHCWYGSSVECAHVILILSACFCAIPTYSTFPNLLVPSLFVLSNDTIVEYIQGCELLSIGVGKHIHRYTDRHTDQVLSPLLHMCTEVNILSLYLG